VGWLIPFGVPLTLIGDSPEQLGQARRQLARIGYDDLARDRRPGDVVLDVRRPEERADGALPQSLAVPLHELPGRLGQLPAGRKLGALRQGPSGPASRPACWLKPAVT
jgi:hypothetical protein